MKFNFKRITLSISIVVFLLLIIGVSYSLFAINIPSNKFTNIVFQVDSELESYINYSPGVSITSSNNVTIPAAFSYDGGESATIELWKTPAGSSHTLYGHFYLDITSISPTLAAEDALTWTIVSDGEIIGGGDFTTYGTGNTIALATDILLRSTLQEFTVYLWLDEQKLGSANLTGTSLSTIIRVQVTK